MPENKKQTIYSEFELLLNNQKKNAKDLLTDAAFNEKLIAVLKALYDNQLYSIDFKSNHNNIDWPDEIHQLNNDSDKEIVIFIRDAIEEKIKKKYFNRDQ